jgi:hypothetical protein
MKQKWNTTENVDTVEEKWKNIKQILKYRAEEILETREKKARKLWIIEEIIELINERRKYKNQNNIENQQNYKRIRNAIQRKAKEAKEKWLHNQCTIVEEYLKRGRSDLAFKVVEKLFCTRKLNGNALRSKTDEMIITAEQKVNR